MKIGHIEIGCETDIDTLVISQLQTGSVWFIPEDRFPRNGMIRAIVVRRRYRNRRSLNSVCRAMPNASSAFHPD
uniref:Uncharacterized protein n=1 Tax=Desertifilum tharense IPPAS B-1220 TaxID=1781255 RepID=A0ACD5GWS9_9CYAN